jgi:hypothetical protein
MLLKAKALIALFTVECETKMAKCQSYSKGRILWRENEKAADSEVGKSGW